MKTVTGSKTLPCSAETFWKVFFDENYTRALYLQGLEFTECQILERTENARKMRLSPKLPAVLQKFVGDSFGYDEHGTLDRARGLWTWKMIPRKELVTTRGSMRIEPISDKECRRHDEVVVEAKMFGVGGLIESTTEKEVRSSFEKELAFFTRWLSEHPPVVG
jgi:hypothetical protein